MLIVLLFQLAIIQKIITKKKITGKFENASILASTLRPGLRGGTLLLDTIGPSPRDVSGRQVRTTL